MHWCYGIHPDIAYSPMVSTTAKFCHGNYQENPSQDIKIVDFKVLKNQAPVAQLDRAFPS